MSARIVFTDESEPSDGSDSDSDASPAFLIDRAPSSYGVLHLAPSLQPTPDACRLKRPAPHQPEAGHDQGNGPENGDGDGDDDYNNGDGDGTMTSTILPSGVRMITSGPAPAPFVGGAEAARRAARRDLNKPYKKRRGRPEPGCRPFWEESIVASAFEFWDSYQLTMSQTFPIPEKLSGFERFFAVLFWGWSPGPEEFLIDDAYHERHKRKALNLELVDKKGKPLYALVSQKLARKAGLGHKHVNKATEFKTMSSFYNSMLVGVLDEARASVVSGLERLCSLREGSDGRLQASWLFENLPPPSAVLKVRSGVEQSDDIDANNNTALVANTTHLRSSRPLRTAPTSSPRAPSCGACPSPPLVASPLPSGTPSAPARSSSSSRTTLGRLRRLPSDLSSPLSTPGMSV